MFTCCTATRTSEPKLVIDAPSSSYHDIVKDLNKIFGDTDLKKSILSLLKTFGGFLDKGVVTKVVNDIGKITVGVPFVGMGVQALVLIINNLAAYQDNKEKCEEIKTHAEFIRKNLEDNIDNEENEEMLRESIIRVIHNAWILEQDKKEREGYVKGAWNCVKVFVCAQSTTTTLDHVALELKQIQENLHTILLVQANERQLHYAKTISLDYDLSHYKIGLQARIGEVMDPLKERQSGNRLQAIGVYGIGGIGKSTLLFGLREHLARKGKDYIVALEVLNESSTITQVQQKLAKQLTNSSIEFRDEAEGQSYLASKLKGLKERNKKVCLILDNLQPERTTMVVKILPDPSHLGEHATFLIVSAREKHVVEKICNYFTIDKKQIKLYEPSLLDEKEARRLFCQKANIPSNIEYEWIGNIVPLLGGLPLALEVYGSYFRDETKRKPNEWINLMNKLKKAQDMSFNDEEKVFAKIEMSLDLYINAKKIKLTDFMDAAIFWKDKSWEDARLALLWEGDDDGLSTLEDKSLAYNHDGYLQMHDILISVAKKKADDGNYMYYQITQESPLPKNQKQEECIRGLCYKDADVSTTLIQKMDSLKFLNIEGGHLIDIPTNIFFQRRNLFPNWMFFSFLLYLTLIIPIASSFLAKYFYSHHILFFLLLSPPIMLLIYYFYSYVLPSIMPTSTSRQLLPKSLTYLKIQDCYDTIGLSQSIGKLTQLRSLNLSRNHGFQSQLPSSIFSSLSKLHLLDMSRCPDLSKIPTSLSKLVSLRDLKLFSCSVLKELPSSIGDLKNLEYLNLSDCHSLSSLPDSIKNLTQLQSLEISNCDELSDLPSSFGELSSLQSLNLSGSDKLARLPPSFTKLHSLQHLDMSNCAGLRKLPNDLGNLTSLKNLNISKCSNLMGIPSSISKLTNLQKLDASHCNSLHDVTAASFEPLKYTLKNLDLRFCNKLKIEFQFLDPFEANCSWKYDSHQSI